MNQVQLNFYFDAIPVILAIIVVYKLSFVRRTMLIMLCKLAALLLIICQTTWIHSYLNNFPMVLSIMENLWTVFNTLVMTIFLLIAEQQEKCNAECRSKV